MSDRECVEFLQWALPRMQLRWSGFRQVRRQVCRRLARRMTELGLSDLCAYRAYVAEHAGEWALLDGLLHITISRFYRDRAVFELLVTDVLPALANGARGEVHAWSIGCASGEEPYTLALAWNVELEHRFPDVRLRVLATDADPAMLCRARDACHGASSLEDLPQGWRAAGFVQRGGRFRLRPAHRGLVTLRLHDVRDAGVDGPFDLVLCRNLVFTYFAPELQRRVCGALAAALRPGGALVVGAHEALPDEIPQFEEWSANEGVYRRRAP